MRIIQVLDEMSEKNISLVSVANTIASYKFLSNDSKLIISKSKKKEKKNIILKNLFSNLFYNSEVSKIIRQENPTLIHVHGLWRPIHLFFILHSVLLNKPIIIQPHGMLLEQALKSKSVLSYLGKLVTLYIFYRILLNQKSFIAVTEEEKSSIKKYFPRSKIQVIQNPIITENIKTKKINKNFVYFGRYNRHKNLKEFINGFISLKPSKDWTFDIYGIEDDKNYELELKNIVDKSGFDKSIIFHKPEFDRKKKFKIISSAWCNVLLSKSEVLSLSVLEAFSVGTLSLVNKKIFFPSWIKNNLVTSQVINKEISKSINKIMNTSYKEKLIKKKKMKKLFLENYQNKNEKNLYKENLKITIENYKKELSINNLYVFGANLLNSILIPFIMILAVIINKPSLGAEIGIYPGIVLILSQIFSANARSILLYNKDNNLYEQIINWRVSVGLLIFLIISTIQFFFYEGTNSKELYLLNILVYISWINEINLSVHEKRMSSFLIKFFLIISSIFYMLIFLNFFFLKFDFFNIIKFFTFFHIIFCFYHIDLNDLRFKSFLLNIRRQYYEILSLASSVFNIFGVLVWRVSLIFLLEKNIAGIFFASFAIASFPGTLFNNIIGQIILINKKLKETILKYMKIYFVLYFTIIFSLLFLNNIYLENYELYFFFNLTLISLIGTPLMLVGLYNRHKELSINYKNQKKIFRKDIAYGISISPIIYITYYLGGENFVGYSFIISSVFAFLFYNIIKNDK